MPTPHLKSRELCFTSRGGTYPHKLLGFSTDLSVLPHFFVVKSSISITMKLMDIYFHTLSHNLELGYLFCCSNFPAMAIGTPSVGSCGTPPCLWMCFGSTSCLAYSLL